MTLLHFFYDLTSFQNFGKNFVGFLEDLKTLKGHFKINWRLEFYFNIFHRDGITSFFSGWFNTVYIFTISTISQFYSLLYLWMTQCTKYPHMFLESPKWDDFSRNKKNVLEIIDASLYVPVVTNLHHNVKYHFKSHI